MCLKDFIMILVLIFDFDGVIAESVDVKTDAFEELFKAYPKELKEILQFHKENGGMSRFDKFKHIYENILKKELTKEKFKELCGSFHKLVVDKVAEAPFVNGARELLNFCEYKYPMYIVSGTPLDEINEIVQRKGLAKYFKQVYGSPDSKAKSIRTIIKENDCNPKETLFIGDSKNDYQAACETGVLFMARIIDEEQEWLKSAHMEAKFRDLTELRRYLAGKR